MARLDRVARGQRSTGPESGGGAALQLYDQVIQAAVGGQGIALGRIPLIAEHLAMGAWSHRSRSDTTRRAGNYAVVSPHASTGRLSRRSFCGFATRRR